MEDVHHRTAQRLERFVVPVMFVTMSSSAFFSAPQTAPRFKRPYYSRKSINDGCRWKSGENRRRNGTGMSFLKKKNQSILLLLLLHLTPLLKRIYLLKKNQFSCDFISGGHRVGSLTAREV